MVAGHVSRFSGSFVNSLTATASENMQDDPNYYVRKPASLISTSTPHTFRTGTGAAIYNSLLPLLESTNHELILVTCFWARSSTLSTLNDVLLRLSDKAVRRGTTKIRVSLCFSSLSLFQKLFHKQNVSGQMYNPNVWASKLGLPRPEELGGLDVTVKSVFLLPFSVMHPKFMIVDRKTVILPSCNISWEEWFEGCITFSGPIVDDFLQFYSNFWERSDTLEELGEETTRGVLQNRSATAPNGKPFDKNEKVISEHGHITTPILNNKGLHIPDVPTMFLPSPHRRNPRFQPFTPIDRVQAPPTPLSTLILLLLNQAEKSIRIQTPNLTSPPVLSALLRALARGVNVRILTSERLMILEQLVTAGTTTSRCIKKLIKRYKKGSAASLARSASDDVEAAAVVASHYGRLQISFFSPLGGAKKRGEEGGEPQQSHLKMMAVDEEVVVLGSGNLDRASWFTSQELGIAFFDRGLVGSVLETVDLGMRGREKVVFDSEG
jgi:phosphatidylserine/phosphatidylglycerophosphate/cardiolipin synthase-like enzyme